MSPRIESLKRSPETALVDKLEALIGDVVSGLDEGKNCDSLVAEINALSGQNYEAGHFFELYGWQSEGDAAAIAAKGPPPVLADLTRDELINVIEALEEGTEPNTSYFVEFLDRNYPGSWSTDLVYWPHCEMAPGETVDELLLRENLYRAGGVDAVKNHELTLAQEVLANPDAPPWATQWAKGVPGARI